jgi:hypothetical protein
MKSRLSFEPLHATLNHLDSIYILMIFFINRLSILIIFSHLRLGISSGLSVKFSHAKLCVRFLFHPRVLHVSSPGGNIQIVVRRIGGFELLPQRRREITLVSWAYLRLISFTGTSGCVYVCVCLSCLHCTNLFHAIDFHYFAAEVCLLVLFVLSYVTVTRSYPIGHYFATRNPRAAAGSNIIVCMLLFYHRWHNYFIPGTFFHFSLPFGD